jgi:hypothetical protein
MVSVESSLKLKEGVLREEGRLGNEKADSDRGSHMQDRHDGS